MTDYEKARLAEADEVAAEMLKISLARYGIAQSHSVMAHVQAMATVYAAKLVAGKLNGMR